VSRPHRDQLGAKRVYIRLHAIFHIGVGVEITVGAAPMAEGDVDVEVFCPGGWDTQIERVSGLFVDELYHKNA